MEVRAHGHNHNNINYTIEYIPTTVQEKRQLAHKLCLMNFNDAFCSYLFGGKSDHHQFKDHRYSFAARNGQTFCCVYKTVRYLLAGLHLPY